MKALNERTELEMALRYYYSKISTQRCFTRVVKNGVWLLLPDRNKFQLTVVTKKAGH